MLPLRISGATSRPAHDKCDMGASMISNLAAAIIHDCKEPSNWEQFHCLPLQE